VWETLAAALHVRPFPGRNLDETVLGFLSEKRLLLLLDNCEHLLDGAARVVATIAQRCPRVAVLATSREGLALAGERIVAVASLAVPSASAGVDALRMVDSVRLFSDRATAAKDDFALTDRNAAAVGVLCRRLDGIPLAIELAAARVRSLPPEELLARLDQRFKLLTRGSRAALERHQTLRSTIDWSYDLLDADERRALERLSVFAGGCDLRAAEAVLADDALDASDVVDVLGRLVDKSLLVADTSDGGGVRYRLLESIRQYAQERLEASGGTETVRRRHAEHYAGVAETAGPHLRSKDQLVWASSVAGETDNFRAALDWAVEAPSPAHALRLVAPFAVTGMTIGYTAMDWAETASAIPGAAELPRFAEVAAWAAFGATMAGDFARAEDRVSAAERALGSSAAPPSVLRARGVLALFRGELERSLDSAEAWVEVGRASGDRHELADALVMRGGAVVATDPEGAVTTLEEAVRTARDAGLLSSLPVALSFLANLLPSDQSERRLALYDETAAVAVQLGDRISLAMAKLGRGIVAFERGEWGTALRAAVETADSSLDVGDNGNVQMSFYLGGGALCRLGHHEPAAVLTGKAEAVWEPWRFTPEGVEAVASTNAALIEALGEERLAALKERGAALGITEAIAYLHDAADLAPREE
jgi:predicted ATPase